MTITEQATAADIEQEIGDLETRRAQLRDQHSAAPIVGKTDFTARRAALDEISAIDMDLASLRGALLAAQAHEAKATRLAQLLDLAHQGAQALRDVEKATQAFDKAILPAVERYSAARQRHYDARTMFYQLLSTLDPVEIEAAGADLSGVLTNLSEVGDRPHDRRYSEPSRSFYGALRVAMSEYISLPQEQHHD